MACHVTGRWEHTDRSRTLGQGLVLRCQLQRTERLTREQEGWPLTPLKVTGCDGPLMHHDHMHTALHVRRAAQNGLDALRVTLP